MDQNILDYETNSQGPLSADLSIPQSIDVKKPELEKLVCVPNLPDSADTNSESNNQYPQVELFPGTTLVPDADLKKYSCEDEKEIVSCLLPNDENNSMISIPSKNLVTRETDVLKTWEDVAEYVMLTDDEDEFLEQTSNTALLEDDDITEVNNEYSSPLVQPNFDFVVQPFQITGAWECFRDDSSSNYTRGCKWAPDGSCLLTSSDDNLLRIFNMPEQLYQKEIVWSEVQEMRPALCINEKELIYDFGWYPNMSSLDPASCCFVSSSRSSPIHMWDAFTGELRCSYRPYNHLDEIVAAHCVEFDPTGKYLFCGFNKMIRHFDVAVPGRKCEEIPTKYDKQGQNGIISCIAFNPSNPTQFAAGSFSRTIGIYKYSRKKLLFLLEGQAGGITHLKFSPDGNKLYSGARMDSEILCWDLRNTKEVLHSFLRMVTTNQRMYFDVSCCGRYVVSGNNNGVVSVWDTTLSPKFTPGYVHPVLEPIQYFTAHGDCANGVSLHPTLPLLATSSGQRVFPDIVDESEDEDGQSIFTIAKQNIDNSLRLWWVGSSNSKATAESDIHLE